MTWITNNTQTSLLRLVRLGLISMVLVMTGCGGGGGGSSTAGDGGVVIDDGGGAGDDGDGDGGDSSPPPAPGPMVTATEAFRFLNQATFGATEEEVNRLQEMGIEAWLDEQFMAPVSVQLPHVQSLPVPDFFGELQTDRVDIWFRNALHGDDQLRQRVAFALSQIMVVSQQGALINGPYALADYYDMLAQNAFGNYRELLEDVTLHPAMGVYLSMLGNERPNDARNIRPDENYAREVMQLFSIGLVELALDGSQVLDAQGVPVPSYDQAVIEGFSHVFTGWSWAGGNDFRQASPSLENQVMPMQLYPDFHDTGAKALLNGVVLPAGQAGEQDLADALDNIFNHPNVGPFIAIRLIQRLVTSNPSPDYIARVAQVFNDNGAGQRGDLGAVVRAILLDEEARPESPTEFDGKIKEPLLRVTQLWRNYDAQSLSGGYPLIQASFLFGQGPLQSPSVFNFFSPFYAPPGEISEAGRVAPELQIATEYQNTVVTNFMLQQAFQFNQTSDNLRAGDVFIDISEEIALADDIDALIDRVAEKLLGGEISSVLREELAGMLERIPANERELRAADAVYFIAASPEYAAQR